MPSEVSDRLKDPGHTIPREDWPKVKERAAQIRAEQEREARNGD